MSREYTTSGTYTTGTVEYVTLHFIRPPWWKRLLRRAARASSR